jgi:hypothetical protein
VRPACDASRHGHGLKPHRVESVKISNDPEFAEKLEDIVGLCLNPRQHALLFCVGMTKARSRTLDRTQPGPPLNPGRSQTLTHEHKRQRTATLFAALSALQWQGLQVL